MTDGPIAVGGVGGSGTRLVAEGLSMLGVHLGQDLNDPLDNLWFTLLFKRREILVAPQAERDLARALFYRRMAGGPVDLAPEEDALLDRLSAKGRPNHNAKWLAERAARFREAPPLAAPRWGWKEPNTHIVAEALLGADPALRYVHLYRNGLEMAFNRNQQQANLWGPVFLGTDAPASPARSLSYWRAAHERMVRLEAAYPGRILTIRFETLLARPHETVRRLAAFCSLDAADAVLDAYADKIGEPVSRIERDARFDALEPDDLDYLVSLGFRVD